MADTSEWRYDNLARKWTTDLPPEKITTPKPVEVPRGTAYGDWPRCAWPAGCTIGVRDGGLCSSHMDLVLAYGHDPMPDPDSTAAAAWKPCAVCRARVTWHGRLTDVEEAAALVWLEDNPAGRLVPSAPSAQVLAMALENEATKAVTAPGVKVARDAKPTAVAAASRAAPGSGTQRGRVLRVIVDAGDEGATDEQVTERLGLPLNTVRPRRLELVEGGYVMDSGDTRATASGASAIVWLATLSGVQAVPS